MRTTSLSVDGKDHVLVFSTGVLRAFCDRYGDIELVDAALTDSDRTRAMDEAVWMLSTMMDYGARYAKLAGIETAEPLSPEALYVCSDVSEFVHFRDKIRETILVGSRTDVQAEFPPNAESTQRGA